MPTSQTRGPHHSWSIRCGIQKNLALSAGKTNSRVNAALVSPNKAYKQDLKGSDYFQITASKEKKTLKNIYRNTKKSRTNKQNSQYLASNKKLPGMLEAGKYYQQREEKSINLNWPQNYIMIRLVEKDIIITCDFHMSKKLQKRLNK